MRSFKIVGVMLAAVILFACGKSEKERAAEKFALATSLYQKGDTITALQQLDSVQSLFPKAFDFAAKAKEFSNKINSEALFRKQQQLDLLESKLAQLETLFDKEKTDFDRFTQYVPKMQKFDRRWNQSFIEVHLDERGDLYISSNYYGSEWLNHTGLRVYDGIFQAKTDSVSLDDPNNHHSEFMNLHWEKVSYKNGKDNGVIQFIADNADRNLKAVFLGRRTFYIVLESFDKKAIKEALQLSNALKRKVELQKEIREFKSRLN
ncbi:MAG TPA: hypothetical protein PLG33_06550 [Prolixibacteraceae bacterium]|nr:hypothetical protein [Prolixibacteraceae bacterium]